MQLTVNLGANSYDILIRRGLLDQVGEVVNLKRRVMVITDDGVPAAYAQRVLAQCPMGYLSVVAQGEGSKSLNTYGELSARLLKERFTRKDLVIALGGGVIGDLAGFVATTYMRGIQFVGIPTTTLSQIDSSIGGKVAINLEGVKNIIGAFHHPIKVLIDPDTLSTLPQRQFNNGLAEAVKAGLIYDPELFELFEREDVHAAIETIVYRSLLMKKFVVEQDEFEQGLRKILNFGHTIGHGLESAAGLHALYHGEAVALGMLPMIEDAALRQRVLRVFDRLSLPKSVTFNPEAVFHAMVRDKKSDGFKTTLIKVKKLGSAEMEDVDEVGLWAHLGRLMS